jgi:hypothetical protein
MPLDKSGSKKSVGKNIRAERKAGKPQKQAVAIAMSYYDRARKGRRKKK